MGSDKLPSGTSMNALRCTPSARIAARNWHSRRSIDCICQRYAVRADHAHELERATLDRPVRGESRRQTARLSIDAMSRVITRFSRLSQQFRTVSQVHVLLPPDNLGSTRST